MGLLRADCTRYSALVLCQCGARFAGPTRRACYAAAAAHVAAAHPDARDDARYARLVASGARP